LQDCKESSGLELEGEETLNHDKCRILKDFSNSSSVCTVKEGRSLRSFWLSSSTGWDLLES
jgi:hypothetical protein